jgi:glycosyltransferase involved in cell wall biosynthesis
MSELPLVSVVVPCLNRAHFLVPTIKSILQQNYPNIECIVVDGGSTDCTIEILKNYGDKIRWISERDRGHADAINKGWLMSNGEILAWLNADDIWVIPDAVSNAVAYFQSNPDIDVVYGDCGAIDSEGSHVGMSYLHKWDLEYAVETCDHCIPQPAAFMRRRILQKVGWLDDNYISKKDHELWLRIGLTGNIRYTPLVLAHARNCPGYMGERGDVTAAACVALTRKFFTLPGVPANILKKKERATSNAYLRGADYAWSDGRHRAVALSYIIAAIMHDPSNARTACGKLKRHIEADAPQSFCLRLLLAIWIVIRAPHRIWQEIKTVFQIKPPAEMGDSASRTLNLLGDRDIEWSWVVSHMPSGPGKALDFGNGGGPLGLVAAQRGFTVTALDQQKVQWHYEHPGLRFIQCDILKRSLPEHGFDLVINCSTVEHVGIPGRYGALEDRRDGDIDAMGYLRDVMAPEGIMLLTIPVGRDALFAPLTRVYGNERLPRLLEGYLVVTEAFWVKNKKNQWVSCTKEIALAFESSAGSWDPLRNVYALGCFVLQKSTKVTS